MTPSIGPAELARPAKPFCASNRFLTGRSRGPAEASVLAALVELLEALNNGGAAVRTVTRFVVAVGKRLVAMRLVGGGGTTGLVATFVAGGSVFVFTQ